ncbi:hypothetical protein, partial [Flavobacterium sp.]|uniref:hypothetical protein n=1 Tax=Flavobacterium sp. TaxID=239 RepID=UPI00391DCDA4
SNFENQFESFEIENQIDFGKWINENHQMRIGTNILSAPLFLIIIAFVIWSLSNFVLDFDGLYGQDAYEYLRYTNALHAFLSNGTNPGDYFWPLYYPVFGAILGFVLKPAISLQAISIFSFLITVKYLIKIIGLLYPKSKTASLYILLFFFLSPIAFRLSLVVMSDMLTVAFIVLCYYNSLLYLKKETVLNLVLALLFGVSAVMTRYVAFVVLFPLGISVLFFIMKAKERLKHLPLLLLIALLLILPHLIVRNQNSIAFLGHNWLKEWSVFNFFQSAFNADDGLSHYFLPNILYAFSAAFDPRYFFAGVFLIIPFFKVKNRAKFLWLFVSAFMLYGFFLAGIPYQNNRYLFLSFPILLVVLFPYFNWILELIRNKKLKNSMISLVVILQMILCFLALKPMLERNSFERKVATQIRPYQNNTLYSFDIDIALQGRDLKFNYQNLWTKKYNKFEENALVLFHPNKFESKWKGQNLMLNWEFLKRNYNLKIISHFPDGWKLYKITAK